MKPRVFIGSSSEGLEFAESLNIHLARDCETVCWNGGAFGISETYVESLEKALAGVEFAVLVVTADDTRDKRGKEGKIPRDNVVFELGLFMGRLGRARTFIVCDPRTNVELPSDLQNVNVASFDSKRSDGDLVSAVHPAATEIVRAIRRAPRLIGGETKISLGDILSDPDSLYGAIVSWPASKDNEIVIQSADTRWVWNLVPTLIHWQMNGVTVRVFTLPQNQLYSVREETARRNLLADLGIELHEVANLEFSGFFLKAGYSEDNVAIITNNPGSGLPLATRYEGGENARAIEALHGRLRWPVDAAKDGRFVPAFVEQDSAELFQLLRQGVKQYLSPKVEFEAAVLPTKGLLLMSPYVPAYKYKQIERLFDAYEICKHKPFTALAVQLRSGRKSVVTPPVVEDRKEGRVVIEGPTRAAYCYTKGIADYQCVMIRGVSEDLPGIPVPISSVSISERSLSLVESTEGYQSSLYRHIERATHPY